jgi:hypothetical protein
VAEFTLMMFLKAMLTHRDLDEMFGGWLSMSRDSVEGDLARRRLHVAG